MEKRREMKSNGGFQILVKTPDNRFAVLAGSNYKGTPNELHGCIQDVINMRAMLEAKGYTIIADLRDSDMSAENWLAALAEMQAKVNATSGAAIAGHSHSHHGAQVRDLTGTEPDRLSEVYCADKFDWTPKTMITDKQMGRHVSGYRSGVIYWDLADCCHAGDSLRSLWCPGERPRYIPNPELKGFISNLINPMVVSGEERKGILLAACRSNQTSADAVIDGKPCGAFTNAFLRAWGETPGASYRVLMAKATSILSLGGYDQRPELDCPTGAQELPAFILPAPGRVWADMVPASAKASLPLVIGG